jgi:hypothetical protein
LKVVYKQIATTLQAKLTLAFVDYGNKRENPDIELFGKQH